MLVVEDLHAYYGESHVLQGISLEVKAGEVVCLLGRNGVGKTTTLKAIIGLVPPRRGRVRFEGREIQGMTPDRIARLGIGFVPEDRRIFAGLTVEENLEVAERRLPASERRWPLERIWDLFPVLAEMRGRQGDRLSGGEQQMLTIARALVTEPRLVLLDEPNEGLAPVVVQQIGRLIDELAKSTTILFTEQNVKFALRHAGRGYIIEKGRIRHHATTEALRADPDLLERHMAV
jgi:branched-chain amino acid transport system ATP-binding protein